MTKDDIWDKKPIRPSSETHLMFERRRYSWEHQLKIEYDELKEKAEKWDELPPHSDGKTYLRWKWRAERAEQKLEAVKKHLDIIVLPSVSDITYLKKLLEAKQ